MECEHRFALFENPLLFQEANKQALSIRVPKDYPAALSPDHA
jgi:hypothetical protein